MSQVVHVQTTITTAFGLLDDDGNVIPQEPVRSVLSVFSVDAFAEAHRQLAAERDRAFAAYRQEQDAPTPSPG